VKNSKNFINFVSFSLLVLVPISTQSVARSIDEIAIQAAVMAKQNDRTDQALDLLRKAFQLNADHEPSLQLFTTLVQQEQKSDLYWEAYRRMQTLLHQKPTDVELMFRSAMLSWRLLHWMQTDSNAIAVAPAFVTSQFNSLSFSNDLELRIETSLRSVLRLQPHQIEARFNLALLKYRQHRLSEVLHTLRPLFAIQPDHSKGRLLWCASIKLLNDLHLSPNRTSFEPSCVSV
jgi:tetratricopeptide (TPR) repeat protein